MPSCTAVAHETMGFAYPSTSTRQMRQEPMERRFAW